MSGVHSKDSILEAFVEASNKYEFSLDISLVTNGTVVSGTLVSAEEYFKQLSKSFKGGNDVAKAFSEKFSEAEDAASSTTDEVQFVHMKDVKIYIGDNKPTPSKGTPLWRGKIHEVDSFFLGKINGKAE
ncbi:gas vesicle accessory protein GvpU [Staphylococcus equorum]|uniref:gas vesicle accessory protein GvpU n=1 Tax=Staphylococcus equorum TaxID=246432 RepID=UPI003A830729